MLQLRPYQLEDVEFLSKRTRAACFNEQRTGKTPTALKVMERQQRKKILIVCPASSMYQWQEEFELWLGKPCIIMEGSPTKKHKLLSQWTNGLIISYDSLKKIEGEHVQSPGFVEPILRAHPDAIIPDEAHRIRHLDTATSKAIHAFTSIPYRLALTATPAPNKPYEIFSILAWLYPKVFTSYWKFIKHFFYCYTKQNSTGGNYLDIGGFKPGRELELIRTLQTISVQRKRKEVMPWLPDIEPPIQVKLPPTFEQLKYIDELKKYYETEHIVTQGILDRLIRYRQICLHPQLLNLPGTSPKINWIKQYITDYPNTPILIFSKFTSFLKLLAQELPTERIGVIIGETPKKERNSLKIAFQEGQLQVLLLNIDVGKETLTLDKAEVTIFTDKFPPIGDIEQAEARFIATTQDKANKPHIIIELMMKGTYDEALYKLIRLGKAETDIINNYNQYLKGVITLGQTL